ncbi:putative esterase with patatin domain [Legionella lansingensis]|uniref:Putative esterase with patatin domain protein n=1 Tax=Legionella lansingensis TaxID=45067 RepID=A0A0W0VPT3_9GAMM|nr:hypothetical protein [Legionella lansingensis]KTD22164.1 putative esterase with patatin domain protein [Legionella lansingensis]SNV54614.1 putative esterase with patatin domain [Legionella lansingensis]
MPREHTELFQQLIQKKEKEFQLDPANVKAQLQSGAMNYETMSDLLRETNDAQFGIVSTLNDKNEWVRDATHAIPLEQRMSHDAPVIDANNTLLRCLSRLRPIDFAIGKKLGEDGQTIQADIKEQFSKLSEEILQIAQDSNKSDQQKQTEINQKEQEFNTFLIEKLHEANLTKGCETSEDAEKLLFHYRNLSSVLTPARTMITLTYDKQAQVLQRETQYPVTEKTPEQKEAIKQLKTVTPYPFKEDKNSHTVNNIATQEADSLFADLIGRDDTALPAQARKTHLAGAKNAFIVKNELIEIKDEAILDDPEALDGLTAETDDDVLWLARMGSPAYVGKGEGSEAIQTHTREDFDQVRKEAATRMGKDSDSLTLHVTTLNTVSPLEKQSTIIEHVYKATKEREDREDKVSYVPTNPDGTFRALSVAEGLDFDGEAQPWGIAPLQKATRLESVSKVVLAASRTANTLSVVHCASGQDRTGTAVEKSIQEWMKKRYEVKGLTTPDTPTNIETMRAEGGNAAEITTHHVHGSPGMKTDSVADNLFGSKGTFSPRVTQELYRKSAKTNKENKVGKVDFLKKPSELAIKEFNENLEQFNASLKEVPNNTPKEKTLIAKGNELLVQVDNLTKGDPKSLDSRSLSDLSLVLATANKGLTESHNAEKSKANVKQLASLANHVSGKSSPGWKALGVGLLVFACAVLVVGGVLAAIPSGGSSLLLAVLGAAKLGVLASGAIAGGAVATSAAAGTGFTLFGREKGLAKSVSGFKTALQDENAPKTDTTEEDNKKPKSL